MDDLEKTLKGLPENPTPEDLKKLANEKAIQEAAAQAAKQMVQQDKAEDSFNAFITETREKFDKYFGHLGYVCFVFDKEKPENKFIAHISNVATGFYTHKLTPYFLELKKHLKDYKKRINAQLGRVK